MWKEISCVEITWGNKARAHMNVNANMCKIYLADHVTFSYKQSIVYGIQSY